MKILLTTDGSRYALAAARAVANWMSPSHATVDVLAVIPSEHRSEHAAVLAVRPYPTHGLGAPSGRKRMHAGLSPRREVVLEWRGAAGRWLEGASQLLRARGLKVREIVRSGDPAEVTLERVMSEAYDLVVVGAKGRGDGPFFRTGSVARTLLERSPKPVLLVRARSTRRRIPSALHPLRVLLAVDGGAESGSAAERCARLFGGSEARASVLVVASSGGQGGPTRRQASILARDTADRVRAGGLAADPVVMEGDPGVCIRDAAQDADLVVMGARSQEPVDERPLGSVSIEVARAAPCSVLVVRTGAPGVAVSKTPEPAVAEASFDVTYRRVSGSPEVEEHARRTAVRLRNLAPDLIHAHMTIGRSNGRRRKGNLYDVRLDLSLPGARIAVTRTPPAHREDESLLTAMDEAYAKARRALVETRRKAGSRRASA